MKKIEVNRMDGSKIEFPSYIKFARWRDSYLSNFKHYEVKEVYNETPPPEYNAREMKCFSLKEMESDKLVYDHMVKNKLKHIGVIECGTVHMAAEFKKEFGEVK